MQQRTSVVDELRINVVSFSSIIEIGDATYFQAFSRALAIQRQKELFYGKEGFFSDYSIFSEPIPFPGITEKIHCHFENIKPIIKVHHMDIIGISSSSLTQIGNCRHLFAETRIHHIRQIDEVVETPVGENLIQLNDPSQLDIVTEQSPVSVTQNNTSGVDIPGTNPNLS